MKINKIFFLCIIIFVFFFAGAHIFLLRYFYYNKYNIHVKNVIINSLSDKYNETFKIIHVNYLTRQYESEAQRYIHIWDYTLKDKTGKIFHAYLWLYGLNKTGDGMFYDSDYLSNYSDTYGQLQMEKMLDEKYELNKYRSNKSDKNLIQEDYRFICMDDNKEQIADILTQIFFVEPLYSSICTLDCSVIDEKGSEIYHYRHIYVEWYFWNNKDKEISEENVKKYLLEQLEGGRE